MLAYTGVLGALPDFFRQFPISLPLSFFLLFFFGTIIGGSQAVVALCMPIAMTAIPDEGLPFLAMLMGAVWAAMELSPTHVCAFVAADYYHDLRRPCGKGPALGDPLLGPVLRLWPPADVPFLSQDIRNLFFIPRQNCPASPDLFRQTRGSSFS